MRRFPEVALLVVGLVVIGIGIKLIFMHQDYEADFQKQLLHEFHADYHWRSVGDSYTGLGVVAIGALMMAASAALARKA